jgi:hypothetical protein
MNAFVFMQEILPVSNDFNRSPRCWPSVMRLLDYEATAQPGVGTARKLRELLTLP